MDLLELMMKRRSIRTYTDEALENDDIEKILQAALLSPSSRGIRPWEFILVKDKDTLMELSKCRGKASKMLEDAQCAIIVFADIAKSDVWVEDCSIAMMNMQLMASSLNLGSCWIQGRLRTTEDGTSTEEFCQRLLSVPSNYSLEAILSIGVPKKEMQAHSLDELKMQKIHLEKF
ncbi:MAG: nitroreductase family protein [Peptostreptococcus sp.]|uniref:nitroreductase family protein n=1 Tax=Peptostreptococcus sp. TaxID=1262 RepID=UPI002FC8BA01